MQNVLFYKFVPIEDLETLQDRIIQKCQSLEMKGKVLLAKEGINGCLSGSEDAIQGFISFLKSDVRFSDIQFKITPASGHTFKKLFVRLREEIVSAQFGSSLQSRAPYVEPMQLKEWLDRNEDVVLVDMRNGYEFDIGHFKNAVKVPTENFRELPKVVPQLAALKKKKIVTYCTGGIRCEKASALLKEQGFEDVYQLHGGIIQYGLDVGAEHWEGKCFMFDERGAIDIDPAHMSDPISVCSWCRQPSAEYRNCVRVDCDKFFIACDSCFDEHKKSCSKRCRSLV